MHELSVCLALVAQLEDVAKHHGSARVERVTVEIGVLAGIDCGLLQRAYPLAAAGTVAEAATLEIEAGPLWVRCTRCGAETQTRPNRLLCGHCGAWQTRVLSGDGMILKRVELSVDTD